MEDFISLQVELLVDQEVQLIPVFHEILELGAFIHEIGESIDDFDMKLYLLNNVHILLNVRNLRPHRANGFRFLKFLYVDLLPSSLQFAQAALYGSSQRALP